VETVTLLPWTVRAWHSSAPAAGQQGIYVSQIGPPIKIADTATAIPGGTGNFTGFGNVSISATDVAFLGLGANGQQGIYDLTGGSLVKVVGLADSSMAAQSPV